MKNNRVDINILWKDLNDELYTFINGKVKDENIAKDILQEVFLKIKTNIHQLKHLSKLTSWVYQITRNSIFDFFREHKLKNVSLDNIQMFESENDEFEYSKLTNCINEKIKNLSSQHKEAIILTSFKNYSQKELSKHLKISYSGTKSRVQKARAILKENILDCPNVESDTAGKLIDFENN